MRLFFFLLLFWASLLPAQTVLPPNMAFVPVLVVQDEHTLNVRFSVTSGHYLYQDKFGFQSDTSGVTFGKAIFPDAQKIDDSNFGETSVFDRDFVIALPLIRQERAAQTLRLTLRYQGCAKDRVCYPPQEKKLEISLPKLAASDALEVPLPKRDFSFSFLNNVPALSQFLNEAPLFWVLLAFLALGLLLSLSPCLWPVIPLLVGFAQNEAQKSAKRIFTLLLPYLLGLSFSLTSLGLIAGLTGHWLAPILQTPLMTALMALLLLIFAGALFNLYRLPGLSLLQNCIHKANTSVKPPKPIAFFGMGVLSSWFASACVAAPLTAVLLFIAQTGNVLLGALALFTFSLGMGLPLLCVASFAGRFLPKSGPWMARVQKGIGLLLVVSALWIISPLLRSFVALDFLGKSSLPFSIVTSVQTLDEAILEAQKPVFLYFYADWCRECQKMERTLFQDERVQAALSKVHLLKADVTHNTESDKALMARFSFFGPPAMVFFSAHGFEKKQLRKAGGIDPETFLNTLKEAFRLDEMSDSQ